MKKEEKKEKKEKKEAAKEATMKVVMTFQEELLGGTPGDPKVSETYIAGKAPDAKSMEEEIEAIGVEGVIVKGKTIFPKEDGKPFVWDYQIKGMFKDSCGMLRMLSGTKSADLKAYRKRIDGLIFVYPRKIFFQVPEGAEIGSCQRPLRAPTPLGERVSLANSETLPAGTKLEFEVKLFDDSLKGVVKEWFDYGTFRGFSQWRNSGKGVYSWEER